VEAMECEGLLSMPSHGNCGHSRLAVSQRIFCPDANMVRSFSCEYKVHFYCHLSELIINSLVQHLDSPVSASLTLLNYYLIAIWVKIC
jgi:hypothetical protein